jgi:hypothetical protein
MSEFERNPFNSGREVTFHISAADSPKVKKTKSITRAGSSQFGRYCDPSFMAPLVLNDSSGDMNEWIILKNNEQMLNSDSCLAPRDH